MKHSRRMSHGIKRHRMQEKTSKHDCSSIQRRVDDDLPWEVICNIIFKLPVKSLVRFKTVSKTWNSLIQTPYFLKLQNHYFLESQPSPSWLILSSRSSITSLYMVDKKTIKISVKAEGYSQVVATCNGLLCLSDSLYERMIIYNPITKESTCIPDSVCFGYCRGVNFGYDAKTNKYKLVRIALVSHIITIGETSWRKIDLPGDTYGEFRHALAWNGEFFWIITLPPDDKVHILIMDIAEEKFRVIKLGDAMHNLDDDCVAGCFLFVFGQYVTMFVTVWVEEDTGVQLWKLVDSKQGLWIHQKTRDDKLFGEDVHVVSTVGNDGLLLKLVQDLGSRFVIYYPQSGHESDFFSPLPNKLDVFSFAPSLVSLS